MARPSGRSTVARSKRGHSKSAKAVPVAVRADVTAPAGDLRPEHILGLADTIQLPRPTRFLARKGETIELRPGVYRVLVAPDGQLVLRSPAQSAAYELATTRAWHELELLSPLALHVPGENEAGHVVMLFPGGAALQAIGWSGALPATMDFPPSKSLANAVIEWLPPTLATALPFDRAKLFNPWAKIWGSIQPGPSPTGFGPSGTPPNWIGATVATSWAQGLGPAPTGPISGPPHSHWEASGAEGSGNEPIPPGTPALRGAFPSIIYSVTPVTVTATMSMVGRVVRLQVTSHVVTLGGVTWAIATWTDVYQIVPSANGPVTFPGVIVATAHVVPNAPPAPMTTWAAEAQKWFTLPTGGGAPTVFELRLDGMWITERTCEYLGRFPGSPEMRCP